MENPSNAPIMEHKPGPAGWLPVWIKAVSKPGEQTFIEITESPDATSKTAFLWVFIAGTVSGIFQAILQAIYAATGTTPQLPIPGYEQFSQSGSADPGAAGVTLLVSLCLSPVAGAIAVIFFALFTAIVQWIAKLFGGAGTFEKLAYAFAAITLPFTLFSSALTLFTVIPFVGYCTGILSFGLGLYVIVLQVMAVKGVNRFGWGAALGALFLPAVVVFLVCICVVVAGLAFFGPAISETFEGIQQFAP